MLIGNFSFPLSRLNDMGDFFIYLLQIKQTTSVNSFCAFIFIDFYRCTNSKFLRQDVGFFFHSSELTLCLALQQRYWIQNLPPRYRFSSLSSCPQSLRLFFIFFERSLSNGIDPSREHQRSFWKTSLTLKECITVPSVVPMSSIGLSTSAMSEYEYQ